MEGYPLPIIEQADGNLALNEKNLHDILMSDAIKDMSVAIISIAGEERAGKSFLLDFILRYLELNSFGGNDDALQGFEWSGGIEAQTKGAFIWSKPFIEEIDSKKVAIIVMDTQGAFGEDEKDDDLIIPFSLSISTLQMYNVMKSLNSASLNPLEIFLKRVHAKSEVFKNLVVILRDWTQDKNYGFGGGKKYLTRKLGGKNEQKYRLLNAHLNSSLCYLWPPPLNDFSEDDFKGSLSEIDLRYIMHMNDFIPRVIEELLKGTHLIGSELFKHIRNSFKAISSDEPLYSLSEVYDINNLNKIVSEIISRVKKEFSDNVDELEADMTLKDIEKLKIVIETRNKMELDALEEFENKCSHYGEIYGRRADELEIELSKNIDDIEKCFDGVLVYENIRKLKKCNGKELELFINETLFGNLFTRESMIRQKSEELQNIVEEEITNHPELKTHLSDKSLIDFTDDLNESLQNLRGRRIKAATGAVVSTAFMVTGGLIGGLAFGGGVAVTKGASKLGKTAAKETLKETAKFSIKNAAGGVLGAPAIEKTIKFVYKFIKDLENNSEDETNMEEMKQNSEGENYFLHFLKDTIIIIDRFLLIGGNVANVIERAKNAEKRFEKKGDWKLLF